MFRRTIAFALALVFALIPTLARAQSDTGEITITVVDTSTGKPLDDARVFLTGAMLVSALTQKSGTVKYTDVPTGIYRVRVVRRGYDGARSNEFEVLDGKDVTVKFAMIPSQSGQPTGESICASSAPSRYARTCRSTPTTSPMRARSGASRIR